MAYEIYESTNVPYINIKFMERGADFDDTSAKVITWNSKENPQWVVSMSHSINGNGQANDLSLELHHHIDPYINTKYGSVFKADSFDDDIPSDDPGFLLNLINDAYNTIYFSYGYAQSKNAKTSDLNSVNEDMESSIKIDEDTWFRMYITEVSNSYDTAGITIHVTAVSSLVTPDALFGTGEAYDWLADPDGRVPHGSGCGYGFLLRKIIKYFAQTSGYEVHIGDLMQGYDAAYLKGKYMQLNSATSTTSTNSNELDPEDRQDPDIEISGDGSNIFQQTSDEGNYEFLLRLLSVYITHEQSTKSVTYLSNGQNVNTGSTPYHKYYRDWTLLIDDSKQHRDDTPSVTITYQTIVYTKNDLTDLYNAQKKPIFGNDEQRQAYYDRYTPFLVESNNDNNAVGALFYNFSSFDRDMLDNYTIDGQNLTKYSNTAFRNLDPVAVCTDIINLDLSTTLIAGLAGFVQNDVARNPNNTTNNGGATTSAVDSEGNEIYSVAQNYTIRNEETNIDTYALGSAMASVQDFAKVLQQLFVSGSVTTPGLGRIITIMSLVNIYVYISNRLDTTSGKYRVLSQVDEINGGVFTTTLEIMKALTLTGETVYNVASANDMNTAAAADTLVQYETQDTSIDNFSDGKKLGISTFLVESNTTLNESATPIRVSATRGATGGSRVETAKERTIYVHTSIASKFSMTFDVQIPNANTNGCKEVGKKGCWSRSNLVKMSTIAPHGTYSNIDGITYYNLGAFDNWEANGNNAKSGDVKRAIINDVRPNNEWIEDGKYAYVIRFRTSLNQDGTEALNPNPPHNITYTYVYSVFPINVHIIQD